MYGQIIPISDEGLRIVPSIYFCLHEGSEISSKKAKLCPDCSTMKARKEQHLENLKIFGKDWICAPCVKAGAW